MWRHPKYYKELRKRNKLAESRQPVVGGQQQSDQTISLTLADGCNGSVRSGPGHKLQAREDSTANSTRGQVAEPQASSAKLTKHQAASVKPQATSVKLQAASVKLQDS